MSNPTIGNESQFNAPFDILPNVIYTNPTTGASQFSTPILYSTIGESTFNYNYSGEITNFLSKNPTTGTTQFSTPILYPFGGNQTFDYAYPLEPASYLDRNTTLFVDKTIYRPSDVSFDELKKQFRRATNDAPWTPIVSEQITLTANSTNLTGDALINKAIGFAGSAVGSTFGIPQVSQVTDSVLGQTGLVTTAIFSTLAFDQLKSLPGVKYADFRARKTLGNSGATGGASFAQSRLDGTSAIFRGSGRAAIYAAASANPLGGVYAVFNLDGMGTTGFGWGDHDNPSAIRNDFTMRSHIATKWDPKYFKAQSNTTGAWVKTTNPVEFITPFRGDRVNVIDFGQRSLKYAYKWNPTNIEILGAQGNITQDFIKFYLTGPKLRNGAGEEISDDIIVFRALLSSLSDTYTPSWTPQTMIGRADPNYHYTGVTRDINLDFTVYATDRDEVKPIWRKLNALAGYTAPEYDTNTIAMKAPWMRITIGDIFHQQPAIITSLSYTLHETDTTWEINIENDPTMMQVPHKISVSLGLTLISDYLPQKGGRFYSLAKDYDATTGMPAKGNDNWLSDAIDNPTKLELDSKYMPTLPPVSTEPPKPPGDVSVSGDYGSEVQLG